MNILDKNTTKTEHRLMDTGLKHTLKANEILHKRINAHLFEELQEIKRQRQEREERLRPLFMLIGLSLSLLIAIIAINWKTYDRPELVDLGKVESDFEEILDIPISNQPPPPPPKKVEQYNVEVVEDEEIIEEIEVNLDVELTEDMGVEDIVYDMPVVEDVVEEKAEEIFQIVEDAPQFPGGLTAFYKYVAEAIEYPSLALKLGVSGKVFVKFVVEKDGSVSQVEVLKGIGAGCDEEAIRVIEHAPNWIPGKQRGRPVRVFMTVPINFIFRRS